jgi:hypothetical protein
MPDLRTIPGVELARTGVYDLSTGPHEFTRSDLQAAIANAMLGTQPRVKLGHIDPRFDGEPAMGVVANMRLGEDGDVLIGDLVNVPGWLADALPAAYPGRSIEASVSPTNGMRITALALLGMTRPGIDSLADLEFALAAAARATPEDPAVRQIAVAITQLRASGLDQQDPTHGPERADHQEASRMTRIEALRALGLSETVTDDQINQALAESPVAPVAPEVPAPAAPATPVAPEPAPVPDPAGVPGSTPAVTPTDPGTPAPAPAVPAPVEDPVSVAASAQISTLSAEVAELRAAAQVREEAETKARRDQIVASAAASGRITAAERDDLWRPLLDIDETRVKAQLDAMAPNRIPVAASSGTSPAAVSAEDDLLTVSRRRMGHSTTGQEA